MTREEIVQEGRGYGAAASGFIRHLCVAWRAIV